MPHELLDRFSRGSSPLHCIDARIKLLLALALIVAVAIMPMDLWPLAENCPISLLHAAAAGGLILAFALARIPWSFVARRLLWGMIVLVPLALSIPASLGFSGGWERAGGMVLKGGMSLTTVLLLVNTTAFEKLLNAARQVGVPRLLVATLAATYRYGFVLTDELARTRRARQARTFATRRLWNGDHLLTSGSLIALVAIRASQRAQRVHSAMLARGHQGEPRSAARTHSSPARPGLSLHR